MKQVDRDFNDMFAPMVGNRDTNDNESSNESPVVNTEDISQLKYLFQESNHKETIRSFQDSTNESRHTKTGNHRFTQDIV